MNISTMKRLMSLWILGLSLLALTGLYPTGIGAAPSAAPATAPLRQASCTLPATVTTADELYDCITAANAGSGTTITLGADIDLTTLTTSPLPDITSTIVVEGAGHTIDGDSSVRIFFVGARGDLTLNQTTLMGGFAGSGGAIFNDGAVSVFDSTFSGNVAELYGGAIYNFGTLNVTNGSFSGNNPPKFRRCHLHPYRDGDSDPQHLLRQHLLLWRRHLQNGTLVVTNSTFSGNSVGTGGGLYNASGTATMTYNTFSGNSATGIGGSIFNNAISTLHLAGNIFDTGIAGENCSAGGTINDNGYNLSDDTTCTNGGTGSATNATLNLGALSSGVHTPQAGSDAIGRIPNGTNINNNGVSLACNGTITDQLGSTRPINVGTACASGAVEVALTLPSLSINDPSVLEGDSGTTALAFTISASAPYPQNITVRVNTANNTATTADNDYVAITNQTATIPAGSTSTTVNVTINGDTNFEEDETLFVNLSNPTNATITDGQGQGTITSDELPNSLTIVKDANPSSGTDLPSPSINNRSRCPTLAAQFAPQPGRDRMKAQTVRSQQIRLDTVYRHLW